MLNKPDQEEIFKKLIELPSIIGEYFKKIFSMIVRPKATFDTVLTKKIGSDQFGPAAFFVTNILMVHLVDHFFGYEIPIFPFETSLISNPFGNFPFIVLRYLLGTLLFLFIFKLQYTEFSLSNLIRKIFPIICYASALYIPCAFFHGFIGNIFGKYLFDSSTDILNSSSQLQHIGFTTQIIIFAIVEKIAFVVWWLYVVYLGLKSISLTSNKKIKMAITVSTFIFLMAQLSTMLIASYIMNSSTIKAIKIVYTGKIYEILSQKNTNYINAMILADAVSNNKQMPEYVRYAYKLIKVTSSISIPTFHNDTTLITEIMRNIMNHDFDIVEKIITKHIDSLSSNIDLRRELAEIVSLRNSPSFVNLKGKTVTLDTKHVDHLENSFPELIRVNDKNYIYVCPIVLSPALLSIFP